MTKLAIVCVTCSALLAACASAPVPTGQALPVPAERILAPDMTAPAAGPGRVVVKRDKHIGGSACYARLFVDARPVADIETGEMVVLFLPPRPHVLSTKLEGRGLCGLDQPLAEAAVTPQPDRERAFRIVIELWQYIQLQPTAF